MAAAFIHEFGRRMMPMSGSKGCVKSTAVALPGW
jgi:hypothetical protein